MKIVDAFVQPYEIMVNDVMLVQMLFHFDDVYQKKKVLIDDEVKQQVMIDDENDDYVNYNQKIEKKK